ncbi:hypothetical protein V498_08591 [Pseudogymnoascus sp. VKM F-4517 (FW-2822)]|nr:hypothetical protein V498_08591 [Pseudogymnoascus sp. VKM F-4517 (FW-2822)]
MGLFDKAKRVLKSSNTKASSSSGSAPVPDTAVPENPSQPTETQTRPVEVLKPLGVNIWSSGVSPVVDVVFLHGLTGHREKTWTAEKAVEPWPKALLATDITHARIITYGYDANVVHWMKPAGQNTVREHSQNLVNDLCVLRARTKTSKRPILFVVHSLGGLVCQDALLLCINPNDEAQGALLDSTRGIAFMGTPNAGSDFESFATGVANIIRLSFIKMPNTQVLEVLRGRSQVLANIKNGFLTMVRRRVQNGHPEIKIHAFVEELPVTLTGHRVVTPDSAVIPGYNSSTIPENHMNMTKFSTKSDVGYERVLGQLMGWISEIEDATDIKVTISRRNTANDLSAQEDEAMNDRNLGTKKYYRYLKRATKFIRRPDLISKITSLTTQNDASPRVCVLYGMGGQGKTALAIDFCREAETKHFFLAIFWFNASTEETLKKDLITLSGVVKRRADQIFESNDERIEFTLQMIESWNRPWLLVFDNYDNPDRFQNLSRYIPPSSHGSILVTSRNSNLSRLGTIVEVPPMSQQEAVSMLYDRVGGDKAFPNEEEHATQIVNLLGCLPLAIDQAGAYIQRRVNFSLLRFIREYDDRKGVIWSKTPTVWEYKNLVYTTWEMSFELLDGDENERNEKGRILTMLSFLDFRNISQEIFRVPRRLAVAPAETTIDSPKWLQLLLTDNGDWDWSKFDELCHDFKDLSLLQLSPMGPGALQLSMHPLVSEWIKHRASLETKKECLLQAIAIVNMCLRVKLITIERPLLSVETEQQFFRHQLSCIENLRELQKKDSTFLRDLHPFLRAVEDDESLQYDKAILDWLGPNDIDRLAGYLSSVVKGTGQWLINHHAFQEWVQGKRQELWCLGKPGSGKTMIASQVAGYLYNTLSPPLVLLIYCGFKDSTRQTPDNIIRSLLRQAVQQEGRIPNEIRVWFEGAMKLNSLPTFSEIKALLFGKFRSTKSSIYIVLDGLDELQFHNREIITILRDELAELPALRIIVTSRNFFGLVELCSNTPVVDIDAYLNAADDLRIFVSAKIANNKHLRRIINSDPALRKKIEDWAVESSNGWFLHAKLLMVKLFFTTTRQQLLQTLQASPRYVIEVYDEILQLISSQSPEDSKLGNLVLMWLAFSYRRPMGCRELQHAIAVTHIQPGDNCLNEDWLPLIDSMSTVTAGLVLVDEEADRVYLFHTSVTKIINSVQDKRYPNAEVEITQTCLAYLSLEPFASGPCSETKLRDRILEWPFALYATGYWMRHAKINEEEHIERIVEFLAARKTYEAWIQILNHIAELVSGDLSPHDDQLADEAKVLSGKLAVCTTPSEAANVLELHLVAATLAERDVTWK